MIELQSLGKSYDGRYIHQDLSLTIEKGQRLCIVGGSGVGKSVLMKLILGLEEFEEGEIFFDGMALSRLGEKAHFKLMGKCGVVFQHAALFDSLTIKENIALRLVEEGNLDTATIHQMVVDVLKKVQLSEDVLNRLPAQLSGGMQKRVAISRAIIHKPAYLFYDEPTTGLDPENAAYIDELIMELSKDEQTTSVIITHDLDTISKVASHIAMFSPGNLVFHGTAYDFWSSGLEEVQAFLRRKNE